MDQGDKPESKHRPFFGRLRAANMPRRVGLSTILEVRAYELHPCGERIPLYTGDSLHRSRALDRPLRDRFLGLGGIFEPGTIRLGLDLSGGSIITYSADTEDTGETLQKGMNGILESMRTRLDAQGLTEANVYLVGDNMITLEIPSITDPNEAVEQFGAAAVLTFRDADGNIFLEGKDVVQAEAGYYNNENGVAQWIVSLELTDEGAEKFAAATKQAAIDQTSIYTYMDDEIISTATVGSEYASEGITGGQASISGNFDRESAKRAGRKHQCRRFAVQSES